MPDTPAEPYLRLWEKRLFDLLLAAGRITPQVIDQMHNWQHSGFSVDKSVRLAAGDTAAIERLTQYIVRCPFSLDRIVSLSPDGKVVYRAEKAQCRSFPVLGDERLRPGVKRNFEVFEPLDFIAEITQHIPDPGAQQIRYYGWYSNRSRGDRAKAAAPAAEPRVQPVIEDDASAYRRKCRQRWAALIKRVFEVDPLKCPECGGKMKIIAFIEKRDQPDVVEKILRHCGLWDRPASRAPPSILYTPPVQLDLLYVAEDAEPYDDARYDASG